MIIKWYAHKHDECVHYNYVDHLRTNSCQIKLIYSNTTKCKIGGFLNSESWKLKKETFWEDQISAYHIHVDLLMSTSIYNPLSTG